ncbi:MAG: hypothetical protein AAF799_33785 [Myxococcota bacterium]
MELEAHITVASLQGLDAAADELGLRVIDIVLDRGAHVSQPMVTWSGSTSVEGALERLSEIRERLREAGHEVLRTKLEAPPEEPTELYLEQHVKLRIPDGVALEGLAQLGRSHGANLSRNARRRGDGFSWRFLTQRHLGPWSHARAPFDALVDALRAAGWAVDALEREAVLLDTAIELDAGWLS